MANGFFQVMVVFTGAKKLNPPASQAIMKLLVAHQQPPMDFEYLDLVLYAPVKMASHLQAGLVEWMGYVHILRHDIACYCLQNPI